MNRRHLIAGLAILVAAPALAAAAPPPAPLTAKPEEVVRNLYDRLAAEAYDYMTDRKLAARYFTASTLKLLDEVDVKSRKNEEPGIDYDPLIDGQDGEVKKLAVAVKSATAEKATVVATFVSFGAKMRVTFDMRFERGAWRVEDILGREGSSLRGVARDYLKS